MPLSVSKHNKFKYKKIFNNNKIDNAHYSFNVIKIRYMYVKSKGKITLINRFFISFRCIIA